MEQEYDKNGNPIAVEYDKDGNPIKAGEEPSKGGFGAGLWEAVNPLPGLKGLGSSIAEAAQRNGGNPLSTAGDVAYGMIHGAIRNAVDRGRDVKNDVVGGLRAPSGQGLSYAYKAGIDALGALPMIGPGLKAQADTISNDRDPDAIRRGLGMAVGNLANVAVGDARVAQGVSKAVTVLPKWIAPKLAEMGLGRTPTMKADIPGVGQMVVEDRVLPTLSRTEAALNARENSLNAKIHAGEEFRPAVKGLLGPGTETVPTGLGAGIDVPHSRVVRRGDNYGYNVEPGQQLEPFDPNTRAGLSKPQPTPISLDSDKFMEGRPPPRPHSEVAGVHGTGDQVPRPFYSGEIVPGEYDPMEGPGMWQRERVRPQAPMHPNADLAKHAEDYVMSRGEVDARGAGKIQDLADLQDLKKNYLQGNQARKSNLDLLKQKRVEQGEARYPANERNPSIEELFHQGSADAARTALERRLKSQGQSGALEDLAKEQQLIGLRRALERASNRTTTIHTIPGLEAALALGTGAATGHAGWGALSAGLLYGSRSPAMMGALGIGLNDVARLTPRALQGTSFIQAAEDPKARLARLLAGGQY